MSSRETRSRDEVATDRDRIGRLRSASVSYKDIAAAEARETGRPERTVKAISQDFLRWLAEQREVQAPERASQAQLELDRLDRAQRAVEQVLAGARAPQCGACGRGPEPALVLRASDRLVRIMERRSALLALDEPKRQATTPVPPEDEVARRRRMIRAKAVK